MEAPSKPKSSGQRTPPGNRRPTEALVDELIEAREEAWAEFLSGNKGAIAPDLVERLLEKSREANFQDPILAERIASRALRVAEELDPKDFGKVRTHSLLALSWGRVGAARRVMGNLDLAEDAFSSGSQFLYREKDPLSSAIYAHLLATFRKDLGRFDEALQLIDFATALYEKAGAPERACVALTSRSSILLEKGCPEEALEPLQGALATVDSTSDSRTALFIRHSFTLCLAELGQHGDAEKLIGPVLAEYERLDPQSIQHFQAQWVQGIVDAGLGRTDRAEGHFRQVKAEYSKRNLVYASAIVSLDLAHLYARQRRTAELKALAAEMAQVFVSKRIHREATMALRFFKVAVEQERRTVGVT